MHIGNVPLCHRQQYRLRLQHSLLFTQPILKKLDKRTIRSLFTKILSSQAYATRPTPAKFVVWIQQKFPRSADYYGKNWRFELFTLFKQGCIIKKEGFSNDIFVIIYHFSSTLSYFLKEDFVCRFFFNMT